MILTCQAICLITINTDWHRFYQEVPLNVLYSGYRSNTQTTNRHKIHILLLLLISSLPLIYTQFQASIKAYKSIPRDINKAPRRPVPLTATLLNAPLDFEADAALEVELNVPVAPPALVVVAVLFGNVPDAVEADVELFETVMNVAEIVVVEAEVVGPTWLTCTVVEAVLARVVVLVVESPLMLKYVEYWKVIGSESSWSLKPKNGKFGRVVGTAQS